MNFFRRYVLHNLPLKLLSLVLAVGLWLAISPDERPAEVAVRAPIPISGPKQHVERVASATTDPVDASGTMTRATFVTNVYVSDPLVQVVRPVPIHVTVTMEKAGETQAH